jgi:tetratricopeptide (TPR) repeat protein
MIAKAKLTSPTFDKFVGLLRKLHELIAQGKGDSDEAEVVRDAMDGPWSDLTHVEKELSQGLSGDLYSLTGDEVYAPEGRSNPVQESELKAAWEAEDYDRVLTLLHRPAPFLKADEIAFMRAHCWAQLGDLETALLFYRHASDILPHDEQYSVMLMLTCLGLGRLSDARSFAARLADDGKVTVPIILLRAAGVLYACQEDLPGPGSTSAMGRIVELIERALEMDRQQPTQDRLRDGDLAQYLTIAAVCYDALGRARDAMDTCETALRLDTNNELAKTVKGALSRGSHPNGDPVAQYPAFRSQVLAIVMQTGGPLHRDSFFTTSV